MIEAIKAPFGRGALDLVEVNAADATTLRLICPQAGWGDDAIAYLDERLGGMYRATPNFVEYVVIHGHNLIDLMRRGVCVGKVREDALPLVDEDCFYFRSL